MRPRVFPAEDRPTPARLRSTFHRFNEAAGIPRGRRVAATGVLVPPAGFNEAAGIPRGRHTLNIVHNTL